MSTIDQLREILRVDLMWQHESGATRLKQMRKQIQALIDHANADQQVCGAFDAWYEGNYNYVPGPVSMEQLRTVITIKKADLYESY